MSNIELQLSSINDLQELPAIENSKLSTAFIEVTYDNQSYKLSIQNLINKLSAVIDINELLEDLLFGTGGSGGSGESSESGGSTNPNNILYNLPYIKLSGESRPLQINNMQSPSSSQPYLSSFLLQDDSRTNTSFLRKDGTDDGSVPYIKLNNESRVITTSHDLLINTNDKIIKIINSQGNKIEACSTSALWN